MCSWKIILVYCLWCLKEVKSHEEIEITVGDNEPPRVFFFFFAGLIVAGCLRAIIKLLNIPLPFRVLLLFVGGVVGILGKHSDTVERYTTIVHIPPRYMLMACLPILMFKTAFCTDAHQFMRSWGQIFFLAIPGVLINAVFTGMIMTVLLNREQWTYAMGILFGTVCSSIYPVEIVAMLRENAQIKHLSILLEGEGMIGDGSVIIMFEIVLGIIGDHISTWYHIAMIFIRFAIGGVLFGVVMGKIMGWIMATMYNDVVNLLIFSMVSAYLTYYIGEEILSVSGVISVVVLGIMISTEKTSLSVELEVALTNFWDTLAYVANTMVFLLVGVLITEKLSEDTIPQDYALVLFTYVVSGAGRLLEYVILAPIVSRIGYGLTFRSMAVAVWSGLRGPVPFCLSLKIYHDQDISVLGKELLCHIAGLAALTLLINATTMPLLLRLLGFTELSIARKVNMNNCMKHLQSRRERTISMLKMDRFLADANWPLVNLSTVLKHPYQISYSDSEAEEEDDYLGFRITTCPECQKEIPNEPTSKELTEMTREARMRILKAKKISYARQYENGMLSKEGVRVLTQAIETAMDTPEALIELDGLHRYFQRQGFVHYIRRKLLSIFFSNKAKSIHKLPKSYWRRVCYHLIMHPAFDAFIYCAIILNVIPISLEIILLITPGTTLHWGIKVANTIFFLIYFMEFILKILGYSWMYLCKHGFRTYFRSCWNIFDFLILIVCAIDLAFDYIDIFSTKFNKADSTASRVTVGTKLARVIRLIRLLRLCKAWYPKLIRYCDSKIDKRLAFAYDVGKGFVTGEEEVADMLIQMIDNKTIREDCRLRMEVDRLAITKELGMVQKDRPWIAITVKTRQAIRATLNSMTDALLELKVSGWVDEVEYAKLMESLEERLKYVRTKIKSVQPSPPKVLFKEVPWMADEEQIADFLYENVVTKMFDEGDVVCADGQMSDGIYIIVTGLLKLKYTASKDVLDNLADYGSLPIMDCISSARFDETVEDYIVSGNCIGELSALTGRPYNCTITADTASQTYVLTHDVIKQAIQRSLDPVNGLESKMWKYISVRLATSILMDTPVYQSTTQDKIHFQLERAFMPNLSYYKIFSVNEMMEDIILIEGVVIDFNTRDCYTAPCYIPRTVQKIALPKSSHLNLETTIETKLLIIPAQDCDEFDIMEKEEEISEMVSTASMKCLQHLIQTRASSRLKRKKKRQTTFNMAHRRVKYGESSISTSRSLYYASGMPDTSSFERELRNINMNETTSTYGFGDARRSQDQRTSGMSSRRTSTSRRRSLKHSSIEIAQDKKITERTKQIKPDEERSKKSDNEAIKVESALSDSELPYARYHSKSSSLYESQKPEKIVERNEIESSDKIQTEKEKMQLKQSRKISMLRKKSVDKDQEVSNDVPSKNDHKRKSKDSDEYNILDGTAKDIRKSTSEPQQPDAVQQFKDDTGRRISDALAKAEESPNILRISLGKSHRLSAQSETIPTRTIRLHSKKGSDKDEELLQQVIDNDSFIARGAGNSRQASTSGNIEVKEPQSQKQPDNRERAVVSDKKDSYNENTLKSKAILRKQTRLSAEQRRSTGKIKPDEDDVFLPKRSDRRISILASDTEADDESLPTRPYEKHVRRSEEARRSDSLKRINDESQTKMSTSRSSRSMKRSSSLGGLLSRDRSKRLLGQIRLSKEKANVLIYAPRTSLKDEENAAKKSSNTPEDTLAHKSDKRRTNSDESRRRKDSDKRLSTDPQEPDRDKEKTSKMTRSMS